MGKSDPQPPAAPDPTVVANAQATANQQTAAQQQKLNMLGSSGPTGTVNWVADPSQPGGYTQQTTYSPSQQALYDQGNQAQQSALGVANQQIGRVGDALGQGLNPNTGALTSSVATPGLQTSYGSGGPIQSQVAPSGSIATSYNQGGPIQSQLNGTTMGDQSVQNAVNAAYGQATSRLDPQWQQQQNTEETTLANQGLGQNSSAYQTAMANFGRDKNDAYSSAYNSAVGAGQAEQAQLFGQGATAGAFANSAQAQGNQQNAAQAAFQNSGQSQLYGQNAGNMALANAAQAQGNSQNAQAAQFGNTAAGQQFDMGTQNAALNNAANSQGFSQTAQAQAQPINEFSALLGSGQVQSPQSATYTPTSVNPTNVLGAYQLNSQVAQQNYQQQMQQQSGLLGGLAQLGGAGLQAAGNAGGFGALFSDARLKEDIVPVGATASGHTLYSYRFKGSPGREVGVLAQEVARTRPDAVFEHPSGFLMVDYGALG